MEQSALACMAILILEFIKEMIKHERFRNPGIDAERLQETYQPGRDYSIYY